MQNTISIIIITFYILFGLITLFAFYNHNKKLMYLANSMLILTSLGNLLVVIIFLLTQSLFSFFTLLYAFAFVIMLIYFYLIQRTDNYTYALVFPLFASFSILLAHTVSNIPILAEINQLKQLSFILIAIHVILIILSYIFFAIAFILSIFNLYRARKLKEKLLNITKEQNFPSLVWYEKVIFRTNCIGFILLTLSLLIGLSIDQNSQITTAIFLMRMILPLLLWMLYAYLIIHCLVQGILGKRLSILSISNFCFALTSLLFELLIFI